MVQKSPNTAKLTKTLAAGLRPPDPGTSDYQRGYRLVWDTELIGFGIRVTNAGAKTYIVRGRVRGKERQQRIGSAQVLSADKARDLARAWLVKICEGRDPITESKQTAVAAVTLREAIEGYCRSGRLRASTQDLVRSRLARAFPDWLDLPLLAITDDRTEKRWLIVSKERPGDALIVFRYLRAVWNHARDRATDASGNPLLPESPTRRLKTLWKGRDTRRQRVVQTHRMPEWLAAVESLTDPAARAFLLFLAYTGCRRSEAAALRWADVDLTGRSVAFKTTKTSSYAIPLPTQLASILTELRPYSVGDHVFGDANGRPRNTKSAFHNEILQIRRRYGEFGPHDLRRGFITAAEGVGVPSLSVKKLVNHSTRGDVTAGYYAADVEALRPHMQRIADALESAMKSGGNVIPLAPHRGTAT